MAYCVRPIIRFKIQFNVLFSHILNYTEYININLVACFVQICLLTSLTFLHESSLKSQTLGLLLVFALVMDDCECSEKVSRKQNQKAEATHGHLSGKKEVKRSLQLQESRYSFIHNL